MMHTIEASRAPLARRLPVLLTAWAAGALAIAASGAIALLPRPFVPLVLLGPAVAFYFFARRPGDGLARQTLERLPLALAIAWHIPRAPIGVAFLVAAAEGRLPGGFAQLAGYGDIVAGLGAIAAIAALRSRPGLVRAWNAVAFADIVLVVVNAQRYILFGGEEAARPFFAFPFPLLPTFYVPLVLVTHGIVFWRLRRSGR